MKRPILVFTAIAALSRGLAQSPKPEYTGKLNPSVSIGTLQKAAMLTDLSPHIWEQLVLPVKERAELSEKAQGNYQGYETHRLGFNYVEPKAMPYNRIIQYESVELISGQGAFRNSARGTNDLLTADQKQLLAGAGINTEIEIRIRFRYKPDPLRGSDNKLHEGKLILTVVPETEAAYPGGFDGLRKFLNRETAARLGKKDATDKVSQAIMDFTVDEGGQVQEPELFQSSSDPKVDATLLRLFRDMKHWKPAQNRHGIRVKQHYRIRLGDSGC